jgi:hypothetical protein
MNRRNFLKSSGSFALACAASVRPVAGFAQAASFPVSGGYHRLFPTLPAANFKMSDLIRLANGDGPVAGGGSGLSGMSARPELLLDARKEPLRNAKGELIISATPENEIDDEDNYGIPAGYTYLGQFVDHDLTFKADDAFAITGDGGQNHRSAKFDLDCLYGAGPGLQPFLYSPNGRSLARGRKLTKGGKASPNRDHPRNGGVAIIGDKRNDENVLVSQLHGVFADFHNAVAQDRKALDFEALRQLVTWHYQWMLLTDFLPRLCGQGPVDALLPGFGEGTALGKLRLQRKLTAGLPAGFMPLEFVDAAYRYGHSAVRSVYRLNTVMQGSREDRRQNPAMAGRKAIFAAVDQSGLNGFREFPDEWAIDWSLYFETRDTMSPARIGDGARKVQPSYKIDTTLTNPLAYLPEFSQAEGRNARDKDGFARPQPGAMANLAMRNLMRGQVSGLPSGQDVARAMGLDVIPDKDLRVGKASVDGLAENRSIVDYGDSFRDQAPLWFYVLAEAQHDWCTRVSGMSGDASAKNVAPNRLGPVGGRLVAETFIALMDLDPASVLHAPADWRPTYGVGSRFGMVDLLRVAGLE